MAAFLEAVFATFFAAAGRWGALLPVVGLADDFFAEARFAGELFKAAACADVLSFAELLVGFAGLLVGLADLLPGA